MPSIPRPAVQRPPSEGSVVVVVVGPEKPMRERGPWDRSRSIGVDVDVLLQRPRRAMVVLR